MPYTLPADVDERPVVSHDREVVAVRCDRIRAERRTSNPAAVEGKTR